MNFRTQTTELSHVDVDGIFSANRFAGSLGLRLNTLATYAPYKDFQGVPAPAAVAAKFGKFLKHLSMTVWRQTGAPFTYICVVHANEDGSCPHLHVFHHVPAPASQRRALLQAMFTRVYGHTNGGGLVAHFAEGGDTSRQHDCGYYGSTVGYMCRFMSQQAYEKLGRKFWRASARNADGVHVGIKAPFTGKRWRTSRNINAKAQEAHQQTITNARISAEKAQVSAAPRKRMAA